MRYDGLLRKNLLEAGEAGQAVFLLELGLALDERKRVLGKVFGDVVALGGDPLLRELLLEVGNVAQVEQLRAADIAVAAVALKADHLVGDAVQHLFDSGLAGHIGLVDVGLGRAVRGAALQQAQLDAANLRAGLFLADIGQVRGQTAQLGMAEAVGRGGLRLGDEAAVGVVDALGDSDDAVAVLLVARGDVSDELVHVEVNFRQIDEVDARLLRVGERGGGGQPAGMTAHALNDGDLADVVDAGIAGHFHRAGRDILGSGGVAGAVVGAEQVVVDGLGHAHDAALVADLVHILGDLVAGVHGVVAAVIAEITDVIFLEDLKDALVVGVVDIGIGDLVAAGAERGRRGIGQAVKLGTVFFVHAEQLVVENALNAVIRAVDLGDAVGIERSADNTVSRCVDDGRRAAGLANDKRTLQHDNLSS